MKGLYSAMFLGALDEFLDEQINFSSRDVGHDDDMSNIFFAG